MYFAPGETSKSFVILITDDWVAENQELTPLILELPELGTVADLAALVIQDDDNPTSSINAIDDAGVFVRQHYHDFLNREPDAAGLAFWKAEIERCSQLANAQERVHCIEVNRVNVSASFFLSIEFQQTGYLVYRLYRSAFPESAARPHGLPRFAEFMRDAQAVGRNVVVGSADWQVRLEQNKQLLFEQFAQRPEFLARYPDSMTPGQYVDSLFGNAGLTPSDAERQSVIDEFLNPSGARARALRRIAENEVFTRREFNRAFVLMQYFGYLRRNPDADPDSDFAGYDFWLSKLNQFGGDYLNAEMVKAFVLSREYRSRFGQP